MIEREQGEIDEAAFLVEHYEALLRAKDARIAVIRKRAMLWSDVFMAGAILVFVAMTFGAAIWAVDWQHAKAKAGCHALSGEEGEVIYADGNTGQCIFRVGGVVRQCNLKTSPVCSEVLE